MIFIGIDPDTKATGIAVLADGAWILGLARAKGRLMADRIPGMASAITEKLSELLTPGLIVPTVVAIEWMHIRPCERNPNSVIGVQAVGGMAVSSVVALGAGIIHTPIPSKWKGNIPKPVHHKRILAQVGLTSESPEFKGMPKSMHTHVIDAIGLALWAKSQSETT